MQLDYFQIWHKGRLKAFQAAFVHRYKINTPCTKKAAGALGSVHISSRGNLLAQKRACCVENARKVSNLAVLSPCKHAFALKILLADEW